MPAQSKLNAERDVLPKIHRTAVAILEGCYTGSHISKPTLGFTGDASFILPFSHDIASTIKLPEGEGARQELLGCFSNRLNEFHERFLSLCKSTYSNANDLDTIRISKHQQKNRSGKKTFNNEYTPLLEEYFEYNAYPSASDRSALARKTMMTPRQIEVWFQNHRNRAKKEGKSLKRLSSNQSMEPSLKSLETDASPSAVSQLPSTEDTTSEDSVMKESVSQPVSSSVDVFGCPAPPHAFPTCYPHKYANPFPSDNGIFRFAPPVWRRRPATANPLPSAPVNLNEFVAMFASKLNLEDCSSTVQTRRKTSLTKPWFAATVTIASPAPHPALLRRLPLSQTIPPPTSVPPIKTSLRSRSPSVTPVSSPSSQIASRSKKRAPLPRRTPTIISSRSKLTSSSPSLKDPVWFPLPAIQAQTPVMTGDMFETFHKYINTKLQPQWNIPGSANTLHDKQCPPFSPYQSPTLLPITNLNYLEVQS